MNVSHRRCIATALFAIVAVSGCGDTTSTQTVIRFSAASELDVPPGSTLSLEVWGEGRGQHQTGQSRGPTEFFDDIKLIVDARDNDASRRFTVFAELLDPAGDRLSWARVRTGFVSDQLSEVRITLAPA